ncbi:MAG TPA: hypothetical protein PKY77_18180 [Phycisphaerae bacterium]|nr:hypothetical protein [Phycisphaerae bacterium]HRY70182.1 hypothetical protein [Phycisphaerae bacterium]HSA27397.1 hypothetical protein [Phycisphaerae bacterium]
MRERRSDHRDRRKTVRRDAVGRIRWRRIGSDWYAAGWLSDRSPADLSFIASRTNEPSPDEEIELRTPDRDRQFARVTRVASYDDELSLVACRVVPRPQGPSVGHP